MPAQHQQIFRVAVLGGVGEIERPGDQRGVRRAVVDHHHLVVGGGVVRVDPDRHVLLRQPGDQCGGQGFRLLAVRDHLHVHAAPFGIDQGLGDVLVGEAVGLHQDLFPGFADGLHHQGAGIVAGRKGHLGGAPCGEEQGLFGLGGTADEQQ